MPKRIVIAGLLLMILFGARAQEKLSFAEADRQSYQLYLDGKWSELIAYSAEVRGQGIDFFYLQVRTGIAFYNLRKYQKASNWFLKAYETDQSFEWLQEYVYYSLVYSGQKQEAVKIAQNFSDGMKKQIGWKKQGMTRLAYEGGISINSDFEQLKKNNYKDEIELGADYGEGYFLKDYHFQSVDLSHRVNPSLVLNHNLTYIGVNRQAMVDWGGQTTSGIKINQFNYYINPVWVIGKTLNLSPSLNVISGSGDVYAGRLTSNSEKAFGLSTARYTDAVFSTSIWFGITNFSPGVEINAGRINDSEFVQASAWVTLYPFSNTNFYFTPKVYFKTTSGIEGFGWNALGLSGGAQVGKVHLYGHYLVGEMENFVEAGGYLVSNFSGKIRQKIMGSVYFPIGKKSQLVFRYVNQDMTEKYQVYTGGIKSKSLDYNYTKHTITGGISWNF
jgi:hypothetical protein